MSVRKYYKHLLGVEIAIAFPDEPREIKVAFMNWFCNNKTDGDAEEHIESRKKLKTIFETYKRTIYQP